MKKIKFELKERSCICGSKIKRYWSGEADKLVGVRAKYKNNLVTIIECLVDGVYIAEDIEGKIKYKDIDIVDDVYEVMVVGKKKYKVPRFKV